MSPGIIINGIHAIEIAKKAGIKIEFLLEEYNYIMAQEYFFFLCTLYERPDLVDDTWITIRSFYNRYYKTYEKFALPELANEFSGVSFPKIRSRINKWKISVPINILRFVKELAEEKFTPLRYLT